MTSPTISPGQNKYVKTHGRFQNTLPSVNSFLETSGKCIPPKLWSKSRKSK